MPHTGTACVNNIVTDPPVTGGGVDQGDCFFYITICLIPSANRLLLLG